MIEKILDFVGGGVLNLIIFASLITLYAVFIWKFYKFLARKNIIYFNFNQYNTTKHPLLNKFLHAILFLAEYIIILPILVAIWFTILGLFLIVLSKEQSVQQILLITAAIVSATRITSYISSDLSKDLAKMFPFTMLAIFLLSPDFFSLNELIPRFLEIPDFLHNIFFYLVVIIIIEFILRLGDLVIGLFRSSEKV